MKSLISLYKKGYGLSLVSLLLLGIFLFPIYWMVVTSLRTSTEIFAYPPQFIPNHTDLTYFREVVFENEKVLPYLRNSFLVGAGTTLLTLLLASPAAYGLAHLPLRGKNLLLLISLSSLMFPAIMLATPMFVMFSQLGFTNNFLGLIIANTALSMPFAITVLRPFYRSIPTELSEAARVDGCTTWTAFWRIILPLSRPGLLTAGIFTFLFGWGDLLFAISLVNSDNLRPITAGLWNYMGGNVTKWNLVMALSTVAMLPPLILFLFAQRYVVAGLTSGSVKE